MKAKKPSMRVTSNRPANKSQPPLRPAGQMPVIHSHAAGIDVGATSHWVCVPEDAVLQEQSPVREFGAFTKDLDSLVEWLLKCGVKTVVMESTSVYWIPLFQKLEAAGLEVLLVNARHVRHVPGRKSDCKDCQWLQRLHSYGLLNGSFRPGDDICRLRTLMRHRDNLTRSGGAQVQHMQQALNQMNIHLHHAVSDLNGETGLRILDAILAGERDPKKLVELRDDQCSKSTPEELTAALEGDWREEHLFVLRQSLENYRHLLRQMEACDEELEKALAKVLVNPVGVPENERPPNPPAAQPKPGKKKKFRKLKSSTGLKRDLTAELTRICGVDLTKVIGLNVLGVLILISEIGVDMSRWRNAKAFCSWLGLCPGNKISGGKILSSRTVHVVNRVSILLRTVAPAVGRSDTWLGIFHRRMRARLGPAAANTATARKLACMVYHLLKYKEEYIGVDCLVYQEKIRKSRVIKLSKQAEELGFELIKKQAA
ncbi:MAG TPA: IS110 family transposase [Candidatus Saccharimonadales bacterium]|nr:IS110 family transposase [Candidatus Saccharimonadales bacterium]